jgi:ribosome-associated heat shock protein Hsp15
MRVDKWLWMARLFKTRTLAADAVKGGRVHVNGVAVKPSREVGAGDQLEISLGRRRRTVNRARRGRAPRLGRRSGEALRRDGAEYRGAQAPGGTAPARRASRRWPAPDQARPAPLRRRPVLAIHLNTRLRATTTRRFAAVLTIASVLAASWQLAIPSATTGSPGWLEWVRVPGRVTGGRLGAARLVRAKSRPGGA